MKTIKQCDPLLQGVLLISLISLFCTVTNIISLSASMAILYIFLPFFLFQNKTLHPVFISLFFMLSYFIISILFYAPQSLLYYDFYRRDGNVFITFAPLITLSLLKLNINPDKIIRKFIIFSSILNGLFLCIYFFIGGTLFFYEANIYHFLFEAHNAAGGFLAVLSALTIGYYWGTKENKFFLFSLINLIGLYYTDSRGSILGLIAAYFIVIVLKEKRNNIILFLIISSQILMLSYLYILTSPNDFLSMENFAFSHFLLEQMHRGHTLIVRGFDLWPKAIYLFLHSPLFGVGFGSYNDIPYVLKGIPFIAMLNHSENIIFSDSHAHHTFLHVLAETGIVGLIFLLNLIKQIKRYINTIHFIPIKYGLSIAFWVAIISSLTEHRFFTPSQMLPFTIILGLNLAKDRFHNAPH